MGGTHYHLSSASGRGFLTCLLSPSWHKGGHGGWEQDLPSSLLLLSSRAALPSAERHGPGCTKKVANSHPWRAKALLQGPSCRTCSRSLFLKVWGVSDPRGDATATRSHMRLIISAGKSSLQNIDKGQILHVPPHISYLLLPGASGGGEHRGEARSAWLGIAAGVTALGRRDRRQR